MASTTSTQLRASAGNGVVSVCHVVDALNIGGAERVAVHLVNLLPRDWYVPNLVAPPDDADDAAPLELPGEPGKRIACVANFRPQKDHPNLLRAMVRIHKRVPRAHLFLIGDSADPAYVATIRAQIAELQLDRAVT